MPVRLAQMKRHPVSLAKVKSVIMSYALVRQLRFCLQIRGKHRVDWTIHAESDALGVAMSVFGKDCMQRYTNMSWSDCGITIDGVLPDADEGTA